ncbi:MAG: NUDIX domain-containing protein [Actinobacteria bacterium]|nr:NUDIX domain-containing protein [Actinomycetota bacterium]MBI3256844.1 NUDIX domain-containing protein [Actinomycetota bacterium]
MSPQVAPGPEVCVGAVTIAEGRLLLVQRGQDPGRWAWSVPGGRVRIGETLAEAVIRELREETGVEGLCGRLLGWVERIDDDRHLVILDFIVDVLDLEEPVAGDDAIDAKWVPLHEVAELNLVEGLAEFLHEHGVLDVIA